MVHTGLGSLRLAISTKLAPTLLLRRITMVFVSLEAAASFGQGHSWPYLR